MVRSHDNLHTNLEDVGSPNIGFNSNFLLVEKSLATHCSNGFRKDNLLAPMISTDGKYVIYKHM
jgi:hypothetical protein